MVKNFIACASAVFFMASFLACSNRPSPKEEKVSMTAAILPAWKKDDHGIWPHKDHKYGFDRHPNPKKDGDGLIYASVLNGENGFVTLKINPYMGQYNNFDYYVCDLNSPYPYISIQDLEDTRYGEGYTEQTYTFTAKGEMKKIGLCVKTNHGVIIAQVLEIHPYDWQEYDFEAYIWGDSTKNDDRNKLIHRDEFWELFDTVYAQAVVRHGKVNTQYIPDDRGYILSRATGDYTNKDGFESCVTGDMDREIQNIFENSSQDNKRRVIIQAGYPIKRFWPLKSDKDNNIVICGKPNGNLNISKLKLEKISDLGKCKDVTLPKASLAGTATYGIWTLKYENGKEEIANKYNIDTTCIVFAETGTSSVIGEINNNLSGKDAHGGTVTLGYASVAVVAWRSDSKDIQSKVSLHELGHTMGLFDLNEDNLSKIKENSSSREDNLMHFEGSEMYKLRKRGVKGAYYDYIDYQWDCLQKKNIEENCADYYNNIEYH